MSATFPLGLLGDDDTTTWLASYLPPLGEAASVAAADARLRFIEAVRGTQPTGDPACDQPLPCLPVTEALGLQVTADGPMRSGNLVLGYDMAALKASGNPREAGAAARIEATFAAFDRTGDPRWRAELAARHGITLADGRLSFSVALSESAFKDGVARLEVAGFSLLGVLLEVTVLSSVGPQLPPIGGQPFTPGTLPPVGTGGTGGTGLIGQDGAGLVGQDGGGIIANDGASIVAGGAGNIISNDGASLIGQDGAGIISGGPGNIIANDGASYTPAEAVGILANDRSALVPNGGGSFSGQLRVPFAPELAKLRLLSFTDWAWGGAEVYAAARYPKGRPGGAIMVATDESGRYAIPGVPESKPFVFLIAQAGQYLLHTLAPAPGNRAVEADSDAATTAVSAWVMTQLASGDFDNAEIDYQGFLQDVDNARKSMTQAQAEQAVTPGANPLLVARQVAEAAALAGNWTFASMRPRIRGITTHAGDGTPAYGDAPATQSLTARFDAPTDVETDGNGTVFVADRGNNRIRAIAPDGTVSTLAGGTLGLADGTGATAQFAAPSGVGYDPVRKFLYVADPGNSKIRKIDLNLAPSDPGYVTTYAGSSVGRGLGDRLSAAFNSPRDVAVDKAGNVMVADRDNQRVCRIDAATGQVTELPGTFDGASGLDIDLAGTLYVACQSSHQVKVVSQGTGGTYRVSQVYGSGSKGFANGGPGQAQFARPSGLTVGPKGYIFVADTDNNTIRVIAPIIQKVFVVGELQNQPPSGDLPSGGGRISIPSGRYAAPMGVSRGFRGALYVADTDNHKVKLVQF